MGEDSSSGVSNGWHEHFAPIKYLAGIADHSRGGLTIVWYHGLVVSCPRMSYTGR